MSEFITSLIIQIFNSAWKLPSETWALIWLTCWKSTAFWFVWYLGFGFSIFILPSKNEKFHLRWVYFIIKAVGPRVALKSNGCCSNAAYTLRNEICLEMTGFMALIRGHAPGGLQKFNSRLINFIIKSLWFHFYATLNLTDWSSKTVSRCSTMVIQSMILKFVVSLSL